MDELPPKTVKAQLVRLDDSLKQIERTQVAGIQRAPGSLPVLEAFQLFLENERRKARRKMLAVTALAVLSILIASVSSVFLVRSQIQDTSSDIERISSRTEALAEALAEAERRSTEELKVLENRFRDDSQRIVEQYSALLDEQKSATKDTPEPHIDIAKLETIEERLNRLEAENDRLKTEFSMQGNLVPLTGQAVAPMVIAEQTNGSVVDESRTAAVVSGSQLIMTLIPNGQQHGIRWMLPLRFTQE